MRQSRYGNFDRLGFINDIQTVLFAPAHKHIQQLRREVMLAHAKETGDHRGFTYKGEFSPNAPNVKFDELHELVGSQWEKMDALTLLMKELLNESRQVMDWMRTMSARCMTLAQVKNNLMPELLSVISSDQLLPELVGVAADDSVLYPQDRSVQNLQLKYIGLRFLYS